MSDALGKRIMLNGPFGGQIDVNAIINILSQFPSISVQDILQIPGIVISLISGHLTFMDFLLLKIN
jgi:hypothetical protein